MGHVFGAGGTAMNETTPEEAGALGGQSDSIRQVATSAVKENKAEDGDVGCPGCSLCRGSEEASSGGDI